MSAEAYVGPSVAASSNAQHSAADALLGEVAGFPVIIETLRYDPDTREIWLLGMGGQATAVRGAWSNLILHAFLKVSPLTDDAVERLAGLRSDVDAAGAEGAAQSSLYALAGSAEGWMAPQTRPGHDGVGRTMIHQLLLPPCTDLATGPDTFLLVQDDRGEITPSRCLLRHLVARSSPPIVDDWESDLWTWATGAGYVRELAGIGRWAYLAHIPDKVLIMEFLAKRLAVSTVDSDESEDADLADD